MLDLALKRLAEENTAVGTPEDEVKEMLQLWCQVDEGAPVLICNKEKNIKGAYGAIQKYAEKHKGAGNAVYVGPETAFAIVMEYFGAGSFKDMESKLEEGLMYRLMRKVTEKWIPYGEKAKPDAEPLPESAAASQPELKKDNTFNLSAFSLEDEL